MLIPEKEEARIRWIEEQAVQQFRATGKPPSRSTIELWKRMSWAPALVEQRVRLALRAQQGLIDDSVAEIMRTVAGNEQLTKEEWQAACDRMVELIGDCEPLDEFAKPEWLEEFNEE